MSAERTISPEKQSFNVKRMEVAGNYGPCEGVNMAIDVTETVLRMVGKREPVYATNPIVHNNEVMDEFGEMGLVLVKNVAEIPRGGVWINSAHAHTPEDFEAAKSLDLVTVDTVCPLVNKVYVQGRKAVENNAQLVYLGSYKKNGELHQESRGFMGQFKDARFVASKDDLGGIEFDSDRPISILNQTTLATDEFAESVEEIKRRRPDAQMYDGICYATDNRQDAVVEMAGRVDGVLVSGSSEISHNTKMLVERAERLGKKVVMIEKADNLNQEMFAGMETVGYTAGASVRDKTSLRVLSWFDQRGTRIQYSLPAGPEPTKGFRWPVEDLARLKEHLEAKYAA